MIPDTDGVPLTPAFWSVDEKVRYMDEWGIGVSLLSLGNPWLTFLTEYEDSSAWADRINEDLGSIAESSGGRFLTLGVLPVSTITDCIAAVENATDRPHLKGFITGSEICGMALDDDRLDPLWQALDRSGCILMLHPGTGWLKSGRHSLALTVGVSFPVETTVAAARLLLAGIPTLWPRVKFLLSHGGGALPYLLGRLDHVWSAGAIPGPLPSQMARGLYADSILYSSETQAFAERSFGDGRLMWGSDHPFSLPVRVDGSARTITRDTAWSFLSI